MSSRLYIISGPPGSGKTELFRAILEQSRLNARMAPKYSTRSIRQGDFDDIINTSKIRADEYRFIYAMNGELYGIKPEKVISVLRQGFNAFLIVSDLRVVREMKAFFGSLAVSLYIYRNISEEQLLQILDERKAPSVKTTVFSNHEQIRLNRLYLMQRQYVENITLFDHLILNTTSVADMIKQVENIITGYKSGPFRKEIRGPAVFLIAGASGSGKRTLMYAMYNLGCRSINVIRKATTRDVKEHDGREIFHIDQIDSEIFDINYIFQETEYGINTSEIWGNLTQDKPQILITNMQQFHKFRKEFDPLVVCVYLHATRTKEELLEWQTYKHGLEKAKLKISNLEKIHQDYIANIANFHHVLLNTMEKEDFWEQMLRLIGHYRGKI